MINAGRCRGALSSSSMVPVPCGRVLLFNYMALLDRRVKLIAFLCSSVTVDNWEGADSMHMGALTAF